MRRHLWVWVSLLFWSPLGVAIPCAHFFRGDSVFDLTTVKNALKEARKTQYQGDVELGVFAFELATALELNPQATLRYIKDSRQVIPAAFKVLDPSLWTRLELVRPRDILNVAELPKIVFQAWRMVDRVFRLEQGVRLLMTLYPHLKGDKRFAGELEKFRGLLPRDLVDRFDWDLRNGFSAHFSFRNRFWIRLLEDSKNVIFFYQNEPYWFPKLSELNTKNQNLVDLVQSFWENVKKWAEVHAAMDREFKEGLPRMMHEEEVWHLLVTQLTVIRSMRKFFPNQSGVARGDWTFGIEKDPVETFYSDVLANLILNRKVAGLRKILEDPYLGPKAVKEILEKRWPIPSDLLIGYPEMVDVLRERGISWP